MMKLLLALWKLFKKPKQEPDLDHRRGVSLDDRFKLEAEPTQLHFEVKPEPPIRKKREIIHIQVGLDFGTSCTKVVYSQLGRRFSRAINFEHDLSIYPNYCIPSLAAIDQSGNLLYGVDAAGLLLEQEWDTGLQRFKVIVAGKNDENFCDPKTEENFNKYIEASNLRKKLTPERLTSVYLAHVINICKDFIENQPEYEDDEVDIAINICMPIEHLENNKVRIAFERIFTNAEAIALALQDLGDRYDPLLQLPPSDYYPKDPDKRVFAIPESVAGLASYLVSLRREDGLHAIIDLGAGTTDVSICDLISPKEGSESLWYSAKNIPMGTINIERIIADHLKACNADSNCTCSHVYDVLSNFNDSNFCKSTDDTSKIILFNSTWDEMEKIRASEAYYHTWGSAYTKHLRKESMWDQVEVFLSGGGSALPYAENVFSKPWWSKIEGTYPVSKLPVPDDYDPGDAEAPFERMTVAYGLSIPKPMLDKYTLPEDAPDQTPPKIRYEWIDRDEKYAK